MGFGGFVLRAFVLVDVAFLGCQCERASDGQSIWWHLSVYSEGMAMMRSGELITTGMVQLTASVSHSLVSWCDLRGQYARNR
jgi:nitric oxide reductase large subunit